MKTVRRPIAILACVLVTLPAWALCADAEDKVIRVYGTTAFANLINIAAQDFMKAHPDIRVEVLGETSELGFIKLLNREANIVMSARKPNAVERRLAERKGLKFTGPRVAWENVAVISNPDASVSELTVDQLRKIYTGEYKNWRDLGGSDLAIMPHSLFYPEDDITVWFADKVLSAAEFTPGMIRVNKPDFLVQHVSVHRGSIGYLGNIQLTEALKRDPQPKIRILRIRENEQSPGTMPSSDIVNKGDYPLVIPLFLFWDENGSDKIVEEFGRYCTERLKQPLEASAPKQ